MADLNDLNFNANDVDPDAGFPVLPAGEYDVAIADVSRKQTKDNTGAYLKLDFQILNGEHQNKHLFENLNMWNANATAVKIAKANLSAICRAVGILTPKDSSEFIGKTLRVKIRIKKGNDEFGDQNRITKYMPRTGTAPVGAAPATAGVSGNNPW